MPFDYKNLINKTTYLYDDINNGLIYYVNNLDFKNFPILEAPFILLYRK